MDTYKPSYIEPPSSHVPDSPQRLSTTGALTEAMSGGRQTPLHHAALNGYTATVELLLTNGAQIGRAHV